MSRKKENTTEGKRNNQLVPFLEKITEHTNSKDKFRK